MSTDRVDDAVVAPIGGIWSARYLPITIANLTVVGIVAFDALAVVAALSSIAEDLGRPGLLPWVITSFLATSAVAVIVAGPVIDAIGVRRTFRFTGAWFLVASLAAAAAPSMELLVLARALQGVGGGLVFAVALAAIGLAYPHELRPRAFTANGIVWGIMGFGGPAFAGLLLAFGGWRLIFIVQLPISALALALGWSTLPSTRDRPARIRTDWLGVAILASLTGCSLVAVAQIGVRWWAVAVAAAVTGLLAVTYWIHSGRAAEPVLARQHLTRYPLRSVHLTSGLVLVIGFAVDSYVPLYVQTTRGQPVEYAAFALVFLTAGWTVGSIIYSRLLHRWREADVILLGCVLILPSVATAGVAIAVTWPLAVVFGAFAFVGMSIGFVSTAGFTLLQGGSDESEMGRVNAAHQFIRTLCITYGVALGGAILLLVVDVRVGDVDAVREVIAGDEIALGSETEDAIGEGVAWIHALTVVLCVGCLLAGLAVARKARSLAPAVGRVRKE